MQKRNSEDHRSANGKRQFDRKSIPEVISIGFDRLELIVSKFMSRSSRSDDWQAPLGVFLSFVLTAVVSDFNDKFGFTGGQWEVLIIVITALSFLWFLVALRAAITAPPIESLYLEIIENARIAKENRALYFIRCHCSDNIDRLLVYYDRVWGVYFLPHAICLPNETEERAPALNAYLANFLGLPPGAVQTSLINGGDLTSVKHSEFHRHETSYHFIFLHVSLDERSGLHLMNLSFELCGTWFCWLSVNEMELDEKTGRKNQDVIRHLRDNFDLFHHQIPPCVMQVLNVADSSNDTLL